MSATRTALYAKLAADATLTALLSTPTAIYHQVAPQDAETPYVVFNKQAGTPVWTFHGPALQGDMWLVKAVDRNSTASVAEQIAARVDVVLTDAALAITGSVHLCLRRDSDVDYPEPDGGDVYRHCGAVYRLYSQPL